MASKETIGVVLWSRFGQYKADRQQLEQQWLKNLRQAKGVYDPELLDLIPADRSKVYPKDTRTKITGFTAKMMEMMFPASDTNFSVQPTPNPNLDQAAIEFILNQLSSSGTTIDEDSVNAAISEYARNAAHYMEQEIKDQLSDLGGDKLEYSQLAKKVVRSAATYGCGILVGPQVRTQTETRYKLNASTGRYIPYEKSEKRPYFEFSRVWDIYPDLSAKTWREQEGIFQRLVVSKNDLRNLAMRNDYDKKAIFEYIKDHPNGNYTEETYESDLNNLKHTSSITKKDRRKYELIRFFGYISGKELSEAGVPIKDSDLDFDMLSDVYLLGDVVVKLDIAPFGKNPADLYHVFVFEDTEDSPLTGTGLPEILRDSQMKLCAVDRATMDNMASSAGPVFEVNEDLMSKGFDSSKIHAFSSIFREGRGIEANSPALRTYDIPSHVPELLNLRQTVLQVFDVESNLPSWLMGNTQPLGEAFRTSNNMSMMQGGANMVTKDIVRSFDKFTVSVISALVHWNMEFNDKEEIKGDFQVMAKGNLSLVAKEVRGAAMEQFIQTLTDDERALFKTRDTLVERLRSRDLPEDLLVTKDEAVNILNQRQQERSAQSQMAMAEVQARTQGLSAKASKDIASANDVTSMTQAKIQEIAARIEMYLSTAKGNKDRGQLDYIKTMLEHIGEEKPNGRVLEGGRQFESSSNAQLSA